MSQRVKTGIAGLDDMLAGGFTPGSVNMVWGAPGAGKTTLGLEFLYRGALQGETGLWISFEEFPLSLYRDAASLGWDLQPLEQANTLQLMFTSPRVFMQVLEAEDGLLNRFPADRIVLDSISHLRRITRDPYQLRKLHDRVINRLKLARGTALLIGESTRAECGMLDTEPGPYTGESRIAFMVDSIVMLTYVEVESAMHRALLVLKMRGSDHAKEIRRFEIRPGGIVVLEQFRNREGILSGLSRWAG